MRSSLATAAASLCLLLPGLALAAPTVVVNRAVTAFQAIEVGGGAELTVRKGAQPTLVLSGEEAELNRYRTEVRDGVLRIQPTESGWGHHRPVKIVATLPSLQRLRASGGVEVVLEAGVPARDLTVDLSGGVHFQAAALDLDTLKLSASGGVEAVLGGKAGKAALDASGGVELDASALELSQLDLDASGGCNLKVRATESVVARASGGVGVTVSGHPARRKVKTSGGAGVSFAD